MVLFQGARVLISQWKQQVTGSTLDAWVANKTKPIYAVAKHSRDLLDRAQLQASAPCLFCPPSHVNLFIRLAFWDACQKRPAQSLPSIHAEKEHHSLHLVEKKKILNFTLIGHLWANHCVWGNAWFRSLKTITVKGDGIPPPPPQHPQPLTREGINGLKNNLSMVRKRKERII